MEAAACSHCLAPHATDTGSVGLALVALLKVCSLGYLIGLAALGLTAWAWLRLRRYLAPSQRADIGSLILIASTALQPLLGALIWVGVVTHQIQMTTNHFHHLMHGGWSRAICGAGLIVLGFSTLIALHGWRRAAVRSLSAEGEAVSAALLRRWQREVANYGLTLGISAAVPTVALCGIRGSRVLVNPEYWRKLRLPERRLALEHEARHAQRHDNLRKLLLEVALLLYGILPGLARAIENYELDSEIAVDAACREQAGDAYHALVSKSAAWTLDWQQRSVRHRSGFKQTVFQSSLSQLGMAERLSLLQGPFQVRSRFCEALVAAACLVLAALPVLLLLSHPLPRCLLACYLGY